MARKYHGGSNGGEILAKISGGVIESGSSSKAGHQYQSSAKNIWRNMAAKPASAAAGIEAENESRNNNIENISRNMAASAEINEMA
jgi:hypothetical protein